MGSSAKGNFVQNWNQDYQFLASTYNDSEIKSRDDFYQKLGYNYVFEDIIKNVNKPLDQIRTLEVGCGGARTSVFLAKKGMQTTVTDMSPEAIRLAAANFDKEGLKNYQAILDDLLNSKLPAASFDVVMSFGLLEHFENIKEPFAAIDRLLAPGGVQIHDIITKRFSIQRVFFVWNAFARFCKRLLTGKWHQLGSLFQRNFPHYENSYSLDTYARVMDETGSKLVYKGGMVIWTFIALPRFLQRALVNWAVRNEKFFRYLDRSGIKWMEYLGACWWLVGRKK